jgi:signal transduction histidine kinase
MATATILLALISAVVGITVLCANTLRNTNRALAILFLMNVLWLLGVHQIVQVARQGNPLEDKILFWSQINAAVAAFLPWSIWLLKESVLAFDGRWSAIVKRSIPWLIASACLAAICFSEAFARVDGRVRRGPLYVLFNATILAWWAFLLIDGVRQMQRQSGVRRMEMQFLVSTAAISCILTALLNTLGNLLNYRPLNRAGIAVVFISVLIMAWVLTYHKIYNARDVIASLAQRIIVVFAAVVTFVSLWNLFHPHLPLFLNVVFSVSLAVSFTLYLDRRSWEWLHAKGEAMLTEMRLEMIDLAGKETQPENLCEAFKKLLCRGFNCESADLHLTSPDIPEVGLLKTPSETPACRMLCDVGWATPESLERKRQTPAQRELSASLTRFGWGVVVTSPLGSNPPSLIVALGRKTDGWLFTYPEVQRVRACAELMDNILTHARLSAQAALQAKVEFLAMMSRALAHDLRNLITPVTSFLVHTDGRYPEGSDEAEVHTAARRSMHVMNDYVREAAFFSDQLALNIAPTDLRTLFDTVHEISAARALARGVTVVTRCEHDPIAADVVLLQRLLTNLVHNAIDASQTGQDVILTAARARPGWVRLEVSDQGCGISPSHLGRIFEAYFTTKEYGSDVRGFGLGLTICQTIAALHHGNLVVASDVEIGTRVSVDLPVTQPRARTAATPAPPIS